MANNFFYSDKGALCVTELKYFTDFQGIGSDPMYKRAKSVLSIVKRYVSPENQDFFATPEYSEENDVITWFGPQWNETPCHLSALQGPERLRYEQVFDDAVASIKKDMEKMRGEDLYIFVNVMKYVSKDFAYCYDGKVVCTCWGMKPANSVYEAAGSVVDKFSTTSGERAVLPPIPTVEEEPLPTPPDFVEPEPPQPPTPPTPPTLPEPEQPSFHTVRFYSGANCFVQEGELQVPDGHVLQPHEFPEAIADDGYEFKGWVPQYNGRPITRDMSFTAKTVQRRHTVTFLPGEDGTLRGNPQLILPYGASLNQADIPLVDAKPGYTFTGWDINPASLIVNGDVVLRAQYSKLSFWKRYPWLAWLLWALLILLLLLLLLWLCRDCSCVRNHWGCTRTEVGPSHPGFVERIIDGDTVYVDPEGHSYHYRDGIYERIYQPGEDRTRELYPYVVHDTVIIHDGQPVPADTTAENEHSDVQDEVAREGGNTHGFMRFSMIFNQNGHDVVDLDAHAVQPNGEEIYYQHPNSDSGELDVDAIRPSHTGAENIVWDKQTKVKDGTYRLFIRNYDGGANHGAKAEVAFNGQVWSYKVDRPINGDVEIAKVIVRNNATSVSVQHSRYLVR